MVNLQLPAPAGFELREIVVSGSPFAYYYRPGEGRAIVALPGFPDTPHLWLPALNPLLSLNRPLFLLFLRGYPPSGPPPQENYTLWALARDLRDYVKALPLKPVDLIGHDWGGVLGACLGAWFPEVLHRLVLVSVPPVGLYLRNLFKNPRQFLRSRYIYFFQLPLLPEWRILKRGYILSLIQEWSPRYPDPERARNISLYFQDRRALTGALSYYRHLLLWGALLHFPAFLETWKRVYRRIRVPTLILTGDEDGGIGIELFEGWERFFTSCRLKVYPGRGHFLPLEAGEEVGEAIRAFLIS